MPSLVLLPRKLFLKLITRELRLKRRRWLPPPAAAALLQQETATATSPKSQVEERVCGTNHGAHDSEPKGIPNSHSSQTTVLNSKMAVPWPRSSRRQHLRPRSNRLSLSLSLSLSLCYHGWSSTAAAADPLHEDLTCSVDTCSLLKRLSTLKDLQMGVTVPETDALEESLSITGVETFSVNYKIINIVDKVILEEPVKRLKMWQTFRKRWNERHWKHGLQLCFE